jgi:hypothetical protein
MSDPNSFNLIPHVQKGDKLEVSWGNSVADQINRNNSGANSPQQVLSTPVATSPTIILCKYQGQANSWVAVKALGANNVAYGPQFYVAKPPELQGTLSPSGITITRVSGFQCNISGPQGGAPAFITPPYDANFSILAMQCYTGVQGGDNNLCAYMDLNIGGRTWGCQYSS